MWILLNLIIMFLLITIEKYDLGNHDIFWNEEYIKLLTLYMLMYYTIKTQIIVVYRKEHPQNCNCHKK